MFHKTIKLASLHMLFGYKVMNLIPDLAKYPQKKYLLNFVFCFDEHLKCSIALL